MIDGSPYEKMTAINGHQLNAAESAHEERRLTHEIERRKHESPSARRARIESYEGERHQDHLLMQDMIHAFEFMLAGIETMNGRQCFRVDASPRPGYVPKSRETKVLTGMRGKLWIDTSDYQWGRVAASVFPPVAFGLFVAHVEPGTEFILDEAPVSPNIWMPTHFQVRVKANILLWPRNSVDDETYSEYRRSGKAVASNQPERN
jgi:hypothetical protein